MPKYKCHKEVHALKIKDIQGINQDPITNPIIVPEDEGFAPFQVEVEYLTKHKPVIGGYYVVYADGYKSFSPADVFEDGYTRF